MDNVQKLQKLHGGKPIQILQTAEEVDIAAGGSAKDMGSIGYLNPNSGWADASRAMEGLIYIITSLLPSRSSTVTWLHSQVSKLQFSRSTKSSSGFMVTGAVLETGEELQAELTILAMGSSASKLLPRSLGNRIRASGQVVAYVHVPAGEEAMKQRGRKVLLDLGTGLFSIPPAFSSTKKGQPTPETVLKVARHGWGYSHIVTVPDIEPLSTSTSIEEQNDSEVVRYGRKIAIHIPAPRSSPQSSFPLEADQTLREFLTSYAPSLAKEPWLETRICWYADTPSGDFLVDYIPAYGKSILVAGGGSGHGFKFLPVIGDYILQILERWLEGKADDENGENRDGEMGEEKRDDTEGLDEKLRKLWRWRKDSEVMEECWNRGDGSRGGRRGMKWDEEVQRKEVRLWI